VFDEQHGAKGTLGSVFGELKIIFAQGVDGFALYIYFQEFCGTVMVFQIKT
jgi:hypothetical protein